MLVGIFLMLVRIFLMLVRIFLMLVRIFLMLVRIFLAGESEVDGKRERAGGRRGKEERLNP